MLMPVEETSLKRREMFTRTLRTALAGLVMGGASGCGTMLHSERRGQPHSDDIDWRIVALDGLCLLLFFVPGVVAFAVDFYTGAIYLPLPPPPAAPPSGQRPAGWTPYGHPPQTYGEPAYPPGSYGMPPGGGMPGATPYHDASPPQAQPTYPGPMPAGPPLTPPLPTGQTSNTPNPGPHQALTRIAVPRRDLSVRRIEQLASSHVGRPVSLERDDVRYSELASLDDFAGQTKRHRHDRQFGWRLSGLRERLWGGDAIPS